MAWSVTREFTGSGYVADITIMEDTSAEQPGAALALFADCTEGIRLGADCAGALERRSEDIGRYVVKQLLADFQIGATADGFAADQIISFAALARGTNRFLIPRVTDHVQTGIWLAHLFFGAEATTDNQHLEIHGVGWSS